MRYSNGRQAYVLRGVGTWVGPVLRYRQLDVASEGAVTAQSNDVPAEARVRAPGQESDG